jgi:uncharacterized UPF0160 family protein
MHKLSHSQWLRLMDKNSVPRSFGTHDGPFHADEVSACALLLLANLIDRDQIVRSRQEARLARCEFVCDVGGKYDPAQKRFDHHQADYRGDLSSAGMILAYLRECQLFSEEQYLCLRDGVIAGVDADDTGRMKPIRGLLTFSQIISQMLPIAYDSPDEAFDVTFLEAVDFALHHFSRILERLQYSLSCRDEVERAMEEGGELLVFHHKLPWLENFFALGGESHPALFVIMPAGSHWKLRAIPPTYEERMEVRLPLPAEWAGLSDGKLAEVSGIEGAIFCHKARFFSVWASREAALQAFSQVTQSRCI